MRRGAIVTCLLAGALVASGCHRSTTAPSPGPDPSLQVTPIDRTGPVRIAFAGATVAPGSTLAGCGRFIEGCAGRLRLSFQLSPALDGPVLYARMYLHATNLVACLWGETTPFALRAGVPTAVEIPADRADACVTPTTIATMAVVVEGPVEVASRQTWALHYVFNP